MNTEGLSSWHLNWKGNEYNIFMKLLAMKLKELLSNDLIFTMIIFILTLVVLLMEVFN
jgi:hypothetical protein